MPIKLLHVTTYVEASILGLALTHYYEMIAESHLDEETKKIHLEGVCQLLLKSQDLLQAFLADVRQEQMVLTGVLPGWPTTEEGAN